MLKYIDLFAGIGGFHCALDKIYESKCVFTSEINEEAAKVYAENFPGCNLHGDIQLSETKNSIPKDFDLFYDFKKNKNLFFFLLAVSNCSLVFFSFSLKNSASASALAALPRASAISWFASCKLPS